MVVAVVCLYFVPYHKLVLHLMSLCATGQISPSKMIYDMRQGVKPRAFFIFKGKKYGKKN